MASTRAGAAIVALTILLAGTACGAGSEAREDGRRTTVGRQGSSTEGERENPAETAAVQRDWASGWSSSKFVISADADSHPLAERLSVFTRPRRDSDALPVAAFHPSLTDFSPLERRQGEQRFRESRRALADAGAHDVTVFLVPTEKGYVCTYVVGYPDDSMPSWRGCDAGLLDDAIWGSTGDDHMLEVAGLVADSVIRVDVDVRGKRLRADLGENAFYLQTTVENSCPQAVEAIVVYYRDGRSRVHPNDSLAPQPAPVPQPAKLPPCR